MEETSSVLRVLTCGHGRGWVSSSLSRVWCSRCEDMVPWVRGEWSLLGVAEGYHGG